MFHLADDSLRKGPTSHKYAMSRQLQTVVTFIDLRVMFHNVNYLLEIGSDGIENGTGPLSVIMSSANS